MVSRLTPLKRAGLLIEALADGEASSVRAVIAGQGEERDRLEALADRLGVKSRVTFAGRIVDAELVDHLARCRAVCFPPFGEDYGFVTAEAFASHKPVITCHDSGGPAELVTDGVNGLVCDPTPKSLAVALRRVMNHVTMAEQMGAAAFARGAALNWANTVQSLITYP
jgi:glycosyltransferase involved in cell wall biosynthesis